MTILGLLLDKISLSVSMCFISHKEISQPLSVKSKTSCNISKNDAIKKQLILENNEEEVTAIYAVTSRDDGC